MIRLLLLLYAAAACIAINVSFQPTTLSVETSPTAMKHSSPDSTETTPVAECNAIETTATENEIPCGLDTTLLALSRTTTKPEPPDDNLAKRDPNPVWRDKTTYSVQLGICDPVTLSTGTLMYKSTTLTLGRHVQATFTPTCKNGHPVTNVYRVGSADIYTAQQSGWSDWVSGDNGGFHSSLFPLLYALSSSMIICILLNFVIFDGGKRPFLQLLSITLSSIYLLVVFITATIELRRQYSQGYLDAETLRFEMESNVKINILNIVFDTFLLMTQVQALMSLFPRQKEKRIIFWLGGCLIVVCKTLWGVSVFHSNGQSSALPAFVYLFQISISIMYAGCVIFYSVTKHRSTTQKSLLLYTIVTIMSTISPIALFIVDVGGWWVVEWTDSVSWLTSALSIVTVWEWAIRVERKERQNESHRVLGRQVFEDDMMYPDSIKRGRGGTAGKKPPPSGPGEAGGSGGDVNFSETIELDSMDTANNSNYNKNNNTNLNDDNNDNTEPNAYLPQQTTMMQVSRLYNTTPMSLSTEGAFRRTLNRALSPVIWLSDQLIELGYFGLSIRSSPRSSSNSNDGDNGDEEMANSRASIEDEPPKYYHPMPGR